MTKLSTDAIRQFLISLSATPEVEAVMRETILVREGHFFGRRFELVDLSAIWFAEEDVLKVFKKDGALVSKCSMGDISARFQPAALQEATQQERKAA